MLSSEIPTSSELMTEKIPGAQIHPRGVAGYARRAGAKFKNAVYTGIAVLLFVGIWSGIAYIRYRLSGDSQEAPQPETDHAERAREAERLAFEREAQLRSADPYARPELPSVTAALGPESSKYLPPDQQTLTQKLWVRFPAHVAIIDAIRRGHGQTITVRVEAGRLTQFADELGIPGVRGALADLAQDGGESIETDDKVVATLQATRVLDEVGDLDGGAPIRIVEVNRPPEPRVSAGDP